MTNFFSPKIIYNSSVPADLSNFVKYVSRDSCLVRDEVWCFWLVDQGIKTWLHIPNKDAVDYYYDKKSADKTFKKIADYLLKNWRQHIKYYETSKNKVLKTAKNLNRSVGRASDTKLADLYQNYLQAAYNFGYYIQGAWAVIYYLEPFVVKKFPGKLFLIMSLDKPITFFQLKRDLMRLSVKKVWQKYLWLKIYNPHDKPYTLQELSKLKKETTSEEIKQIYGNLRLARKKYLLFLREVTKPKLKSAVELVHAYTFIKTDRMDVWRQTMYGLGDFYKYVASKLQGTTFLDIINCSSSEIKQILLTPKKVRISEIRQRRTSPMFIFEKSRISVVKDLNVTRKTLGKLQSFSGRSKELRGIVVSRGLVRGRARVILSPKDLHKVKKGDIFIASFTYPTYTPYMAKCRAIVTDEGGLTGHAAVVSRELGIPCIVGVRFSTRAFKDGDLIEVNANKGIVRKIK